MKKTRRPAPQEKRATSTALTAAIFAAVSAIVCAPSAVAAQSATAPDTPTARAVRAAEAPRLDGRADDAVWAVAPETDDFRQFSPGEALPARFRTSFRVAYDDRTLYVLVRAYDPRPDSIVALLSRRDIKTPSDWIKVVIDGYHDRRTGMQFMVNPAGVKRDANIYSDVIEDIAWDAVWDVATSIDAEGWTAEFAIPFSQIRYEPGDTQVFGFGIWRDLARYAERDAWPVYRPSFQTFASQLGDLVGIEGIGRNRRLEVLPYVVSKNVSLPRTDGRWEHPQQQSVGLDFKAGLTSNITIDATINPDFGQVEADPAVLNLSAFEVRFDERRPFFQEGVSLFRCNGPCEGIFYTRRVGRTPQLRSSPRDPLSSAIQGAAKITGRFANGTQFGLVAVSSAREEREDGRTIEPQTTTLVGRLVRDFRGGRSQLGTMVTGLMRDLDAGTEPVLRRDAYTVLVQGYHRFADRWEVNGYSGQSLTRGSEAAIQRTQLSSVHYHQRPDADREFDPDATSMSGSVTAAGLRRYAGRVRWETNFRYATPNTELNDLGFVTLINDVQVRNQLVLVSTVPKGIYRRANAVFSVDQHWTTGGLPTGLTAQAHASSEFANFWSGSFTWNASQLGATHCVSCARGGPALRMSPRHSVSFTWDGDARKAVMPELDFSIARGDEGRSWSRRMAAGATARVGARTSASLGASYERRVDDAQSFGNHGAAFSDTTHYTFTRLGQHILGITARANVTLTPALSLELYAQPFLASLEHSDWRELADPRASGYADRFAPFAGAGTPPDVSRRQFNSNAVLRWEYRPGSVIFVVWQQGRSHAAPFGGDFDAGRDLDGLFGQRPDNTLLVKASYWFNP